MCQHIMNNCQNRKATVDFFIHLFFLLSQSMDSVNSASKYSSDTRILFALLMCVIWEMGCFLHRALFNGKVWFLCFRYCLLRVSLLNLNFTMLFIHDILKVFLLIFEKCPSWKITMQWCYIRSLHTSITQFLIIFQFLVWVPSSQRKRFVSSICFSPLQCLKQFPSLAID